MRKPVIIVRPPSTRKIIVTFSIGDFMRRLSIAMLATACLCNPMPLLTQEKAFVVAPISDEISIPINIDVKVVGFTDKMSDVDKRAWPSVGISGQTEANGSNFTQHVRLGSMTKSKTSPVVFLTINDSIIAKIKPELIKGLKMVPSSAGDYWKMQSIADVYFGIMNDGYRYDLRRDAEDETLTYLRQLEDNHLIFHDSFLEDYLITILLRVFPSQFNDGRPGIPNIVIYKGTEPNAKIFPNGTVIITTGLLSTINSEEELMATLAHEVAHFALDHYVVNIREAEERVSTANFWQVFSTTIAAAGDVLLATQNKNYVPGILTVSVAGMSSIISSEITERLGLAFSREQEYQADQSAVEVLKILGHDHTALASVLQKIKNYCVLVGDYYSISGEGTHPEIDKRIDKIGYPKEFSDKSYDGRISLVNTFNANLAYQSKRFIVARGLVERNIDGQVATEDDLILNAMSILSLENSPQGNLKAMNLLTQADSLQIDPNLSIHKYKAIVNLRLNRTRDAISEYEIYLRILNDAMAKIGSIQNEHEWLRTKNYLVEEIGWTKKMINKVRTM